MRRRNSESTGGCTLSDFEFWVLLLDDMTKQAIP